MKIAIEGCCHGEIEVIYNSLLNIEKETGEKIDLLICCGDYEALRNIDDLQSLAVPDKYKQMGSFHHYYSGRLTAPILTLVIGGNHESSNFFSELPYGGWICHNVYYMGRANIINFGGLRIGALSGIYKEHDYKKGHFEQLPLNDSTMRSIYHIREIDTFKLLAVNEEPRLDIMFSHDWPQYIINYGDKERLYRRKEHLQKDGEALGSPAGFQILKELKPKFWFSAHLHCKYAAIFPHNNDNGNNNDEIITTKFLALDKVLPGRDFLQVLDFQQSGPLKLHYDLQWLSILYKTKSITDQHKNHYQTPLSRDLFKNLYTDEECKRIENRFIEIHKLRQSKVDEENNTDNQENKVEDNDDHHLEIPLNFIENTVAFDPSNPKQICPTPYENPQKIAFNNLLDLVCGEALIEESSLSQIDSETFRKELYINQPNNNNNNNNNENNSIENPVTKLRKTGDNENVKIYKDESEINIDDEE